jgi:hypothetical protein
VRTARATELDTAFRLAADWRVLRAAIVPGG